MMKQIAVQIAHKTRAAELERWRCPRHCQCARVAQPKGMLRRGAQREAKAGAHAGARLLSRGSGDACALATPVDDELVCRRWRSPPPLRPTPAIATTGPIDNYTGKVLMQEKSIMSRTFFEDRAMSQGWRRSLSRGRNWQPSLFLIADAGCLERCVRKPCSVLSLANLLWQGEPVSGTDAYARARASHSKTREH